MDFDIKTIMILYILINIISVGAVAIIWNQNHKSFGGITYWLVNTIFQTVGLTLIVMRGIIPDFVSIIGSNSLILIGDVVLLIGLEIFVGKKITLVYKSILLIAALGFIGYFTVVQPNITNREIIISFVLLVVAFWGCRLLLHTVSSGLKKVARITGIVMAGYIVVSGVRIILLLLYPLNSTDFFKSGLVDSVAIILYMGLTSCLTISLILMVNKRLLQQVQAQEEKFTLAFHSSPYAIMLTRLSDGVIFEVNDGFVNTMGYSYAEAIGKTTIDLHLWETENNRTEIVNELLKNQQVYGLEYQFRKKSGEMLDGLYSANIIWVGNEECILSSISDITEISHMKKLLQERAFHDDLTGLPNRLLFYDRFEAALANAMRYDKKFAVMSLDIDHFKTINDRSGHFVGDAALVATAEKLVSSLRKIDTVARFGGDEFVILLWEIENREDIKRIAEKIIEEFRQPMKVGNDILTLTLSIGASIYPEDGKSIDDLVKKSDISMYIVKENGRNNYHIYDQRLRQNSPL